MLLVLFMKVAPDTPIKKAIVKSTFEDANNYMKDGVYLRQVIDVIDEIEFDDVKESHAFGFVSITQSRQQKHGSIEWIFRLTESTFPKPSRWS